MELNNKLGFIINELSDANNMQLLEKIEKFND